MIRLSTRAHVALGQTFLLVSLMLMSLVLGLVPDRQGALRQGRAALAETIAANSSAMIAEQDILRLDATLRLLVERNDDILSAAVRKGGGETMVTVGDHDRHWRPMNGEQSNDAQIVVPIWTGDGRWHRAASEPGA